MAGLAFLSIHINVVFCQHHLPNQLPIGSMGLVYLPTCTIKINHSCRYIYQSHGSVMGCGMEALVALINPQMPRVHGDGIIHFSHFDAVVHHDGPLWIHKTKDGERRFRVDFWGPENP